jgi:hypothetical protein
MNCFNCYTDFHRTGSNPLCPNYGFCYWLCPNYGFCYWCRDFTCIHHDENVVAGKKKLIQTTKRLVKLEPKITFPMHGSCIDATMFSSYTVAIMNNEFAYSGNILGQKVPIIT